MLDIDRVLDSELRNENSSLDTVLLSLPMGKAFNCHGAPVSVHWCMEVASSNQGKKQNTLALNATEPRIKCCNKSLALEQTSGKIFGSHNQKSS